MATDDSTKEVYFTLLVYLSPGQEMLFREYESKILPLLPLYNGELKVRMTVQKEEHETELPDEIHVVSFRSEDDYENYKRDERRASHAPLLEQAVRKSILIKGRAY